MATLRTLFGKILSLCTKRGYAPHTFLIGKFNNFLYCALIAESITDSESARNFNIKRVSSGQKKSKMRFGRHFWPNLGLISPEFWFLLFFNGSISFLLEILCWIWIWNWIQQLIISKRVIKELLKYESARSVATLHALFATIKFGDFAHRAWPRSVHNLEKF